MPLFITVQCGYTTATKTKVCGYGGIGRRAALRSLWGNTREGSSPFIRTIFTKLALQNLPLGNKIFPFVKCVDDRLFPRCLPILQAIWLIIMGKLTRMPLI